MPGRNAVVLIQATEVELAYTAGIVDGEGTLSIGAYSHKARHNFGRPMVNVSNTDPRILLWLRARFGGSIHFKGKNGPSPRAKPLYRWYLGGFAPAANFVSAIRPFLLLKAAHADLILEYAATGIRRRNVVAPEHRAIRERLHLEISKLNRRGVA